MEYPKISIVTPSFNQAEFLEKTICSVLSQNYPNLEYIIIDGGSTDGSVEIIKKYADRLTYWVSEKDNGQYHAINNGFLHTTGDIMGWINSSDIYFPWTLQTIAEIFNSNQAVHWLSGMPVSLSEGIAPQSIYPSSEKNKYDILCGNYKWIQQESVFWKRRLWNKAGGKIDTGMRNAADFGLWLNFFAFENLYYVNTILAGFRFHDVRRGDDASGVYYAEAASLYKKFRSTHSFSATLRAFVIKVFIGKNVFLRKLFKKLKLFGWYKHYAVYYDYEKHNWSLRIY